MNPTPWFGCLEPSEAWAILSTICSDLSFIPHLNPVCVAVRERTPMCGTSVMVSPTGSPNPPCTAAPPANIQQFLRIEPSASGAYGHFAASMQRDAAGAVRSSSVPAHCLIA